jgi:ATPase subunit of ABC transporter with duplicated ATPase domains
MLELTMYNIRKVFGDNEVLFDAGFQLYEGDRAGMVGTNGCGKSTILKLLAGIEPMDIDYRKISEGKSRITYPAGTTVAYLDQLPDYPGSFSVIDVLKLAFRELYQLEEQLSALETTMEHLRGDGLEKAMKQYSRLQQEYEAKGGYEKEEKFNRVCTGLKFDKTFLQKELHMISGGEKTAVMLGKILLENPDILLLDEPTNHLDMGATEWLENYLRSYRGIVIVVSHDRYFLNRMASKIIEVENKQCETYLGNYSDYEKQKEENLLLQYEQYKEQCKKISAMEKAIKDLRDWAMRADNNKFFRRAVSMQRKLDKMQRIDRPNLEKRSISINFKDTRRSGNDILKVTGLSKSFGDRVLLENAELFVTMGERVAVIGPNGCGKTTLLKLLLGEMDADSGSIMFGASLKIAYLPQIITFNREEDTVIDCFREDRSILEGKAREYLAKYMFFGKSPFRKVKQLSGGERVRLKLSMLLYDQTNLLIMDEPTNHLDIDSIEALEEALEDFKGTILFISHDRFFINKVSSRVIAVENNSLASYPGNYDDYNNRKTMLLQAIEQAQDAGRDQARKKGREKSAAEMEAEKSKRISAELSSLENDVKTLEGEVRGIDDEMVRAGDNYEELKGLYLKKEELGRKLDALMETWLGISSSQAGGSN